MNTKGVEDGITDEQAVLRVYPDAWLTAFGQCRDGSGVFLGYDWQDARAKLPIRSATPEELTAQRENYGKNYKPGPRQAVPFMPSAAVPVEERTALPTREAVETALRIHDYPAKAIKHHLSLLTEGERKILFRAVIDAAQPVPERTAEMEQLMGRLRRAAERVKSLDTTRVGPRLATYQEFEAAASPENILKLLDHIEGKAKAVSQEVKE